MPHEDEILVRDHSERLARLEAGVEKIDKLSIKIDALNENVIALRTERNFVVGIAGLIAGFVGGMIGKIFN